VLPLSCKGLKVKNEGSKTTRSAASKESALETLVAEVEAVSLELRYMKLDLEGTKDELESARDELEDTREKLDETELELKNTKNALVAANRERVLLPRPKNKQEVFAVLKFRNPQPLPVGAFCLFVLQQKAVKSTLDQFTADNPDLDAVEVEELRFDGSPRGQYVYQHMRDDKDAPIKFHYRRFVIEGDYKEGDMKEYILDVFNTHTRQQ